MADEDKKPVKVTYHPAPGDPDTVETLGKTFKAGEAIEVDAKQRDKFAGNPMFSIEGEKTFGDEQREQAEKAAAEDEDEPLTFDEAVLANRMEEYGTSDPISAEQMRQTGISSFDRPLARRRGRPSRDQLREEAKARAEEHDADKAEIRQEQASDQAADEERQSRIEQAQAEQRAQRPAPQPAPPAAQPVNPQPRPNK